MASRANFQRQSRKMALCGMLTALSAALLAAGSLLPLATAACPMLAMLCLLPVLLDYGPKYALLVYAAVSLPVFYRFGGTKARTVMIAIVAALSSLIGMGATALQLSGGFGRVFPSVAIFALPLTGLAALALSRRISIGIMERKKL